jgi:uracil-DNA glycosylase family 4
MLSRLCTRSGLSRETIRIGNVVSCEPPGDWLDGAPWQHSAISQCGQYRDPLLQEPHRVIVTLGAVALRQVLDLWGADGINLQNFHGTVQRIEYGPAAGRLIVPTYHPSHIQRGAANLTDVVRFDLTRAKQAAEIGWQLPVPPTLHLDPSPLAFQFWASTYLQELQRNPDAVWLAVDIETADKVGRDEGELTPSDTSTQILRVNFAYRSDEGVTVPYEEPYRKIIDDLLAAAGTVLCWFKSYDEPRLRLAGHKVIGTDIWDVAWAFHHLQSDLPLGLGFVAPLYSVCAAWKHLAKVKGREAEYAALDGVHTLRCGHGVVKDLLQAGLWEAFYRHTHEREKIVLRPAHEVGLRVNTERLNAFHQRLQAEATTRLAQLGDSTALGTLKPKDGYREKPEGGPPAGLFGKNGDSAKTAYLTERIELVARDVVSTVRVCRTCGKKENVGPRHRCPKYLIEPSLFTDGLPPKPEVVLEQRREPRWFWKLPFNPDASQQILRLIQDSGEQPGLAKKSKRPTGNKETLQRLLKKTKNPIYQQLLEYKAIKKIDSTYVVGTQKRIWADERLHPFITFRPSTLRDSSVNPNIQNVYHDRGGPHSLASGFRDCIEASPGCMLIEADYVGIEAVETGWMMGDGDYVRLAYLGIHAFLASHLLNRPASLSWSDADLAAYFKEIKQHEPAAYNVAKRCVHANAYGMSTYGMVETFPDVYPTLKDAQQVQDLYYGVAPKLKAFHQRVRDLAHEHGYLGGPWVDDYYQLTQSGKYHVFSARHWFWSILSLKPLNQMEYRKSVLWATKRGQLDEHGRPKGIVLSGGRLYRLQLGEDAKRAIAFYPQSIAAGRLKEAQLDLFHPDSESWIGDVYYGKTPFRAPIHDSLLLEVPNQVCDRVIETVVEVMRREELRQPCPPELNIGPYLRVDVAVKVGKTWGAMTDYAIPPMTPAQPPTQHEPFYMPDEIDERDDIDDLAVQLG